MSSYPLHNNYRSVRSGYTFANFTVSDNNSSFGEKINGSEPQNTLFPLVGTGTTFDNLNLSYYQIVSVTTKLVPNFPDIDSAIGDDDVNISIMCASSESTLSDSTIIFQTASV
jgi:hypothetical protein